MTEGREEDCKRTDGGGQKEEFGLQDQALGRAEALNYEGWGGRGGASLEEHCV